MNPAIAAIYGISHEIYRPVQNQKQFSSDHKNYYCLHTQLAVDNESMIGYVKSGFLGHHNYVQTYCEMCQVGT